MKFDISSSELLSGLVICSGSLSSNPVLPILEDYLFKIQDNVLTIAATNLETTIITNVDVMADNNFTCCVPAKILLDTLKALPNQPISFSINEENLDIKITSSYGEYKLTGNDSSDFPEIPSEENVSTLEAKSGDIMKAINNTSFAVSNDELRLAMTGVLMQLDYNKIIFVATDAQKLVKHSVSGINSELSDSFIIPKKSLQLVKNVMQVDETVNIAYNKKNVFFNFGETKIIARLIDAKYPDYNAVLPASSPNLLKISKSDFQNSLRRIAIYANKTTNQVVLSMADSSLTISAQDIDFSNEATEQLTCEYSGEPITISFSAKFLIEMLGIIGSDEVELQLDGPSRAGILVPGEQKDGQDLLMLIMPVMVAY